MTHPAENNNVVGIRGGEVVKADTDEGYTRIANSLLEAVCQCELSGRQFRILMAIIRKTYGYRQKVDWLSASQIKEVMSYDGNETNLRADIRVLKARKILICDGKKIGPNPVISEWKKTKQIKNDLDQKQSENRLKTIPPQIKNDPQNRLKTIPTKERKKLIQKKESNKPYGLSDSCESATPEKSKIPYQKIVDLYHEILPMMPTVAKLTDKRKKQIKSRWSNGDIGNLDEWQDYFEHVKDSKFLTGRATPSFGRKVFMANLEWLTNESNFVKVWEGQYHGE